MIFGAGDRWFGLTDTVEKVSKAIDLLEFDHCIELRSDRSRRQFDAMITTLPLDELEELARGLIAQEIPCSHARARTFTNVVFICSIPLFSKYSTFVENSRFWVREVSSTTDVGSRVTAINVCGYSDEPESELRILALKLLCEKFSEFQPSSVQDVRVFKSSERVTIVPHGEDKQLLPSRVGESRLFLASRELGHGMPVSMNTELMLAKNAVGAFLEWAPIFACGARQAAHAAGQ